MFRRLAARALMHTWPFHFGLETLMHRMNPPAPPAGFRTTTLRGYPVQLRYDPQSMIGRYLYYRGMYEDPIVATLKRFLRPGMTFVDVGANNGIFTMVAAHLVGPSGRVISFEPQKKLHPLLMDSADLNGFTSRITFSRQACGKDEGTAKLFHLSQGNDGMASLSSAGTNATAEEVKVTTLARALATFGVDQVEGLKVDIEGAEFDLLQGSAEWFTDHRPRFILMECADSHLERFQATSQQVREFLTVRGYTITGMSRGRWSPLPDGRVSANILAELTPAARRSIPPPRQPVPGSMPGVVAA